jgi:acetylglutamate kinase
MKDIIVVKIGGSTFSSRDTTIEDIVTLQQEGLALIVVHGGGSTVTDWLKRLGTPTRFIRGERVTDLPTLEVVTAVLAGLVNKEITAAINARGGRAVGISGIDGSLIESTMKDPEMGYVGAMVKMNPTLLEALLKDGFIPVVSPLSLYSVDRPAGAPAIMNVNGDPIAGDIAAALTVKMLVFMTDVAGVNDGNGKLISRLSASEAEAMIATGVVSGGMIPKINACLKALKAGSVARIIDGRKPHALLREIEDGEGGTTIYRESSKGR